MFSSYTETSFSHVQLTCYQRDLDAQAWCMLWQLYLINTTQTFEKHDIGCFNLHL